MNGRGEEHTIDRDALLAANQDAARFYRNQLFTAPGSGPRDYLTARGFGTLLQETPWTVGYAPASWTALVRYLRQKGYSSDTLVEAGLACRTRRHTVVDRFRDRVTFGIRNQEGELVGFTARCAPSAPAMVPKYLNTPTTAIYRKSDVAFGLGEQQERIRAGAVPVLVEGPFDAIAVQVAGQEHQEDFAGLALCGTAMSPALAARLAQLNDRRMILAFDSDEAGTRATERAAVALAPEFAEVLAVSRHSQGDPAEVLRRSGGPTLLAQLRGASPASDQVVDAHMEKWAGRLDHIDVKVGCLRQAAALIARLRPADPAHHTVQLARRLGISEEAVTNELVDATSPGDRPATRAPNDQPTLRRTTAHGSRSVTTSSRASLSSDSASVPCRILQVIHRKAPSRHSPRAVIHLHALAAAAVTLQSVVPSGRRHSLGKLIYAANASLDGYLEDETGSFDWSVPDDEVHAFWNEHERHIGTSLYGRRMYETMRIWESDDWLTTEPAVVREYAGIWRDADKVVYSTTLEAVSTARTRIERQFEPDAVRRLKEASSSDLSIGGAAIGAEAFRHGLVDECVLLLHPVLVGGGKPALPQGVRLDLELLDHRRFRNGVIHVRYEVRSAT